jgi:heme O synthase-like polyprenyltransferase
MIKTLFLLAVAGTAGYYYGFHDAQTHSVPVLTRVVTGAVGRTGGSNRKNMSNDVDAQMKNAER